MWATPHHITGDILVPDYNIFAFLCYKDKLKIGPLNFEMMRTSPVVTGLASLV